MDASTSILFVCTGNIFRSLAAEYALKAHLGPASRHTVSSAGIGVSDSFNIRASVRDTLLSMGLDVANHMKRQLVRRIALESDFVIAMSEDHQRYLNDRYGRHAPLFTEASGSEAESLFDVDDVLPESEVFGAAADAHISRTIEKIIQLTPSLARNLLDA